ncbi:MAG: M56 family metallopeptidase [Sporichthyaceae bacterium]
MIAPILLGYAALLLYCAAPALERASWPARAPRLGIWAWLALTTSALAAAFVGGLSATLPTPRFSTDLGAVFHACLHEIRERYASPEDVAVGAAGAALAVVVAARLVVALCTEGRSATRERARHHEALKLAGRSDGAVVVVPCSIPAAYSLSGPRRVVVTAGAREVLDETELAAVVAHERAHLRHRHHRVVLVFACLGRGFGRVGAFAAAERQVRLLVEYAADDAAARCVPRHAVASAIARVADGTVPASTLGAAGVDAVARAERMSRPAEPLCPSGRVLATGAVLMTPTVLLVAPTLASVAGYCA